MSTTAYSSASTIATVARREMAVAAKNRGIMVTLAILLVLIIAGIALASYGVSRGSSAAPEKVAVVGVAEESFADTGYEALPVADRAAAEDAVFSGDAEAALVPADGGGWDLLVDGSAPMRLTTLAHQITGADAMTRALELLGVDPAAFAAALPDAGVTQVDISDASGIEADPDSFFSVLIALAGVVIVFFAIMFFAANIGSRITEEKSSRVVEIILAAVRPVDFLAGKIIGNAIFGFLASAALILVGAVGLAVSGLLEDFTFDWSLIVILLITFILGLLFFGSLYAAAGAMVQRTEDLQSTQMPVLILVMISIYVPAFGWSSVDSTWMQVLAWIPPFSVGVVPLQYAAGNMSGLEVAGSFALMALVTLAAIRLVARIYRASILHNGQKMGWLQALRAQPA